jgi:hypothetical protein
MAVKFTKPEINVREKLAELDKPSGIAGEAMLRADTVEEQANLIGYTPKNIIINGDMKINQRGTQTSGSVQQYPADRWQLAEHTGGGILSSRESDGPHTKDGHFKYYTQLNVATADTSLAGTDYGGLFYKVEGYDLEPLNYGTSNARTLTLSFWHCHSVSGTFSISIRNAGAGSNRNFVFDYQQDVENVWQKTTMVVPGDVAGTWTTGNVAGMSIMFTFVQGSSYALADTHLNKWYAGTYYHASTNQTNLMAAVNNKFRITGVQLVAGSFPEGLPFQFRSYGEELALCQRYFYKWESDAGFNFAAMGYSYSTTGINAIVHFPVTMRAQPSCTVDGNWRACSATCVTGTPAGGSFNTDSSCVTFTCSGISAGVPYMVGDNNDSSASLSWSAEL